MAATKYYVDGINGNNANNGLTPATAFETVDAALLLSTNSSNPTNIVILEDSTLNFDGITSSSTQYFHLFPDTLTNKTITVDCDTSTLRVMNWQAAVDNIDFVLTKTNTQTARWDMEATMNNCSITIQSTPSTTQPEMRTQGAFNNMKYDFSGGLTAGTYMKFDENCTFNKCQFANMKFGYNSSSTLYFNDFIRCTFKNVRAQLSDNYIFPIALTKPRLYNCSFLLNFGQDVFDLTTGNNTSTENSYYMEDCVLEAPAGSTSEIFMLNEDFNNIVSIKNCVLFNVITHNPIYNIQTENIVTSTVTNYNSEVITSPDYLRLTDTADARGVQNENVMAGAFQGAPLVLFPATDKVAAGEPFGNGTTGDRVGTRTDALEADVRLGKQFGGDGDEFTGQLVIDIVDGNKVIVGTTYNGVAGKYVPADNTLYKSGITFGEENGTYRTGEAVLLENQPSKIPFYIKTSDGSDIGGDFPAGVNSSIFYVLDNTSVDARLTELGLSETIAGGDAVVSTSEDNGLLKLITLVR